MRKGGIICAAVLAALAGCHSEYDRPAPPEVTEAPVFPSQNSSVVVPIDLSLDAIQRGLEARAPRQLWRIDEQRKCVAAQRVKVLGQRLKVTPDIGCRIVGTVVRGPVTVSGAGQRITIAMPVRATISARDVGGVLKGETATGAAIVRADARITIDRDWNPHAKVDLSYDWTNPPGIDFLGQRIRFVDRADSELAKVLADLEREIQKEIANARLRPIVADAWRQGFTVVSLNREKPPAWMRVTPTAIGFAGYRVEGRNLQLVIAAEALTETFVSDNPPAAASPTPLPAQLATPKNNGLRAYIPVFADYAQLEPVLLRALRKLAKKGIRLEGVGSVDARFDKVTIYATDNNRIAVGIDAQVEPIGQRTGSWGKANGRVWMTAVPYHSADSEVVRIRDLEVYGGADRVAADLLLHLASSDAVRQEITNGLAEDFGRDYQKVLTAARKAIADRQEGDFHLTARIDKVSHAVTQVTGVGLFLPVVATGVGEIRYAPRAGR